VKINRGFSAIFALFFVVTFQISQLYGNNKINTDSIDQIIAGEPIDSLRVDLLNKLFRKVQWTLPGKASEMVMEALELAQKIDYKRGLIGAYLNMGSEQNNKSNYTRGMHNYKLGLFHAEELKDTAAMSAANHGLGVTFWKQGNYTKALEYYYIALGFRQTLNDTNAIANSYANIGIIYKVQRDYKKALEFYRKSLEIKEKMNDKTSIAMTSNNIGNIYYDKGDMNKALAYYIKVLQICEEEGLIKGISVAYTNIGRSYRELGKLDEALNYLTKALKIQEDAGNKWGITYTLTGMGNIEFKRGNDEAAINYFHESISISKTIGADAELLSAYEGMSKSYAHLNRYEEALAYEKHLTTLKDTLFNEEKSKEIGKLEARYEMERKIEEELRIGAEKAKDQAEQEHRRNILQYSGMFILIIALFGGLFALRRVKVSVRMAEAIIFIPFLIFFEFLLVLFDPYIGEITQHQPAYVLMINAMLAGLIFPLHHFFEESLKKKILKDQ